MSPESLRESVGFLLDHSGENRKVSIVLFGGEPLLRFPLLRAAVHEARAMATARGKEISFSLTTNGTLVTREIAGFLKENGVSVCVSIDGPRESTTSTVPTRRDAAPTTTWSGGSRYLMEHRDGLPRWRRA